MACREETAEELRARYEREWNELCEHMKQAGRQLGALARHATIETRLRLPGPPEGLPGRVGVLRRSSRNRSLRGLRAGAGRNHRRHGGGSEGPAALSAEARRRRSRLT